MILMGEKTSGASSTEDLVHVVEVLERYEVRLPFEPQILVDAFVDLNSPHHLLPFLAQLHGWLARQYGEHVAARVMPELSAVHAQMIRSALGDLSYVQLEDSLKRAGLAHKFPRSKAIRSQAHQDMSAMLKYICTNNPKLTKTRRLLNYKSVADINSLFVEPQETVHKYSKATFVDRDEDSLWKLRFLRIMASSSHMTYVRNGSVHVTKNGRGWLEIDEADKVSSMCRIWCEDMDWGFWNPYYAGELGEMLHFEQLVLYQAILTLDRIFGEINIEKLNDICSTICDIDNSPDEYGLKPLSHLPYMLVIRPFEYLGMVEIEKSDAPSYHTPKSVALNDLGRWCLNTAINEEWSWTKARSACIDCGEAHSR